MIRYWDNFLTPQEADQLYDVMYKNLPEFTRDVYKIMGKDTPAPRLTQTYGPEGCEYTYSGMSRKPNTNMPKELKECMEKVSNFLGFDFNYAFVNFYDKKDYIGFHRDSENNIHTTKDGQTTIASVSLGEPREFRIRQIYKKGETPSYIYKKVLNHGSLCTMEYHTQLLCKHSVPVKKDSKRPRINITFRKMLIK